MFHLKENLIQGIERGTDVHMGVKGGGQTRIFQAIHH